MPEAQKASMQLDCGLSGHLKATRTKHNQLMHMRLQSLLAQ